MKYRPFLVVNTTIDLCSILGGLSSSPIMSLFLDDLRKNSNLIHPCPHRGHFYIKEHAMDLSKFPPIIPAGLYYIQNIYYTKYMNADHVFLLNKNNFEVIPVGIERF